MTKYRLTMALLCGAGLTSLLVILIRLSMPSGVALLLSVPLLPGMAVAQLAAEAPDIASPLIVLAASAVFYAAVSFVGLSVFGRGVAPEKLRRAMITLAPAVTILVVLVCIPALNPLWPRGMSDLTKQEQELRDSFPLGMKADEARAVLRSKGIQFQDETETSDSVVMNRPDESIKAAAGDRVISTRLETDASQFPCGYDIEVVLLFGSDNKMTRQYVHRLRLCP